MSDEGVSLGDAIAKRFTDKAVLVILRDRDEEQVWIPLSQIHDNSELYDQDNNEGELIVSTWFAEKEGLC